MKKHYLFTLIFSLIFSFSFSQTTYYVATAANGGNNSNNGTSEATPKLTLAAAVSAASSGDTINVGPGTFSTEANIAANKDLTIIGHGRDETIFDGSSLGVSDGFMAITADVTLKNCTIQKYTTTVVASGTNTHNPAGIVIGGARGTSYTTSSPLTVRIKNVKFYDLSSSAASGSAYGGAISTVNNYNASNHTIFIEECIFFDNYTDGWGGAIHFADGTQTRIENSSFMNNHGYSGAGAIFFADYSASSSFGLLEIYNCTIWSNYTSGAGYTGNYNTGGISTYTANGENLYLYIRNSVIVYNKVAGAGQSGSYYWDVMPYNPDHNGSIHHTFTKTQLYSVYEPWMDSIDSYSATNELYEGENTYGALGLTWDDDKRFNFASTSSSLIGQADATYAPSIDINGVTRPQGSGDDIGAFEYRNQWDGSESTD